MPAGAVIGSIELFVPLAAYKFKGIRTYLIVLCQCGTIMSALLLWLLPEHSKGGLLFAVFFLASFGGSYACLMGVQIANTAGYTKRSLSSSGTFVGYCLGNFVGPLVFKEKDAPRYAPGFIIVVVTSIIIQVQGHTHISDCAVSVRHHHVCAPALAAAGAQQGRRQYPPCQQLTHMS